LDTSLWIKDTDGKALLHAVDNPIKPRDAQRISETFGVPDLAFLPYGGASFFPHAFPMYSPERKRELRDRVKSVRLRQLCDVATSLKSRFVVPAAGSYVMGSRIAQYSEYLHQATPAEIAAAWNSHDLKDSQLKQLSTGDVIDCNTGEVTPSP